MFEMIFKILDNDTDQIGKDTDYGSRDQYEDQHPSDSFF